MRSPGMPRQARFRRRSAGPSPHAGRAPPADLPPYTRSLLRIRVPVVVTLARKRQALGKIVELGPGSIIQFDKSCEELLELSVGDHPVASGEAVKVGDKFGLRILSMTLPGERFQAVREEGIKAEGVKRRKARKPRPSIFPSPFRPPPSAFPWSSGFPRGKLHRIVPPRGKLPAVILLIDNYDSFTYNLVQRLGEIDPSLDLEVHRNDQITVEEIEARRPSHLIISPGPCTPDEAGISLAAVKRFAGRIPLLGVCLGHQAIGQAFGGRIVRAGRLMHGKTDMIHHDDRGLYEGLPNPFEATRYHSLVIQPGTLSDEFEVCAWSDAPDGTREIMGIRHRRSAAVRRAVSSGEFPHRLRHDHPGAIPGGKLSKGERVKGEGGTVRRARMSAVHPPAFIPDPSMPLRPLHIRSERGSTPRSAMPRWAARCCGRPCRRWGFGRWPGSRRCGGCCWCDAKRCRRWRAVRRSGCRPVSAADRLGGVVCLLHGRGGGSGTSGSTKDSGWRSWSIWPAAVGLLAGVGPLVARPALLHAVAGGTRLLARGAPLAAAAALGHLLRLAGAVVLLRLLFAPVRGAVAGGRPSSARAGDRGGAGGLDGAGIGPRPPAHRHDHGEPGPHASTAGSQLIQVSDLAGAFGVSFLVMFVAACLGRMAPCDGTRWAFWPLAPAWPRWPPRWSTASSARPASTPSPAAGWPSIQGSIDTQMKSDPRDDKENLRSLLATCRTRRSERYGKVDLIVWPETMFPWPLFTHDAELQPAGSSSPSCRRRSFASGWRRPREARRKAMGDTAREPRRRHDPRRRSAALRARGRADVQLRRVSSRAREN